MTAEMAESDALGLVGRQVVITGGAGALGAHVVTLFRRAGAICHVPIHADTPPAQSESDVRYVTGMDLTRESSVVELYEGLPAGLWASVHLAGGFTMSPLVDTRLVDLRQQLDLNVVTSFLCCREAVRAMRRANHAGRVASGRPAGGRIVQVASRSGLHPAPGQLAYSVSKAAIVALTSGLAEELKAEGILVNAVAPGTLDTPANRMAMPNVEPQDLVSPADVAALIVWLASPANAASGATIPIYGNS
jgi:NAD(P)-dependent dehydrogenase (short-subunit alcohol dehydrogenase family)